MVIYNKSGAKIIKNGAIPGFQGFEKNVYLPCKFSTDENILE
jgi:hypothetical protein